MINNKDILTLSDGNQYGVVSKTIKDNKTYYYLVDINDNSNIKFCYEDKTQNQIKLVEIEDKDLIKELMLSFFENIKDEFKGLF